MSMFVQHKGVVVLSDKNCYKNGHVRGDSEYYKYIIG